MAASKRSGRYAALKFLELDNFKWLIDTHGHDVGELATDQVNAITQANFFAKRIRIILAEPYILICEQDSGTKTIYHWILNIGVK